MEHFNLLEYSIGFIFPAFMVAMTWMIAPGGVIAVIMEYPLPSAITFLIMIVFSLLTMEAMGIDFKA